MVALKVLRPESIDDPYAKERFICEARDASAFNHYNITIIHKIDELSKEISRGVIYPTVR